MDQPKGLTKEEKKLSDNIIKYKRSMNFQLKRSYNMPCRCKCGREKDCGEEECPICDSCSCDAELMELVEESEDG